MNWRVGVYWYGIVIFHQYPIKYSATYLKQIKGKKQWNIKSQYSPTTCPTISPCFAGYTPQTSWKIPHCMPLCSHYSISIKNSLYSHYIPALFHETQFFFLICYVHSSWNLHPYPQSNHRTAGCIPDIPALMIPLYHGHWITMVCCLNPSFSSFNPIISPSRFPQRATFFHPLTHGLLGIPHD